MLLGNEASNPLATDFNRAIIPVTHDLKALNATLAVPIVKTPPSAQFSMLSSGEDRDHPHSLKAEKNHAPDVSLSFRQTCEYGIAAKSQKCKSAHGH